MPDISIALGGGGIKGIAHLGILKALVKNGFNIKAVSGTSVGGLVGAVFAAGYSPEEIITMVKQMDQKSLFKRGSQDGPSLLGFQGLANLLSKVIGGRSFEDLPIPFACTAVDINTSQEIILNRGRLADAVLSTIAIPGLFPPRHIQGATLVDGGIMDPVPVAVARWLSPTLPVVAVSLNPSLQSGIPQTSYRIPSSVPIPSAIIDYLTKLRLGQAMQIFLSGMEVSTVCLTDYRLKVEKPEVVLRPEVSQFGILDEVDPDELISLGEKVVMDNFNRLTSISGFPNSLFLRMRRSDPPGRLSGFTEEPK